MAVMKLVDSTPTTIQFDPFVGFNRPDILPVLHLRARDGTLYSYKFYHKKKWTLPIAWILSADAAQLNTWWENVTDLTFYPDLVNLPATSYNVRIVNRTRPLDRFSGPNWETYFQGTLEIEER